MFKKKSLIMISLLVGAWFVIGGLLINKPAYASGIADSASVDPPASFEGEIIKVPKDEADPIMWLLKQAIKILSGLVGAVAVVMFIFAGVSYAAAGDSSEKVQKAKEMMLNTVIGILLYIFMFAILNFLIPGGIIGG